MVEYTEGVCEDGAAILRDGQMMTISEVLEALNDAAEMLEMLEEAAEFVQPFNRAEDLLNRIEAVIAKAEAS